MASYQDELETLKEKIKDGQLNKEVTYIFHQAAEYFNRNGVQGQVDCLVNTYGPEKTINILRGYVT